MKHIEIRNGQKHQYCKTNQLHYLLCSIIIFFSVVFLIVCFQSYGRSVYCHCHSQLIELFFRPIFPTTTYCVSPQGLDPSFIKTSFTLSSPLPLLITIQYLLKMSSICLNSNIKSRVVFCPNSNTCFKLNTST